MKQTKQLKPTKASKRRPACLELFLTPSGVFHRLQENDSHVSAVRWMHKLMDSFEGADAGEAQAKPAGCYGRVFLRARNGKCGMLDFEVAKHASSKQAECVVDLYNGIKAAFLLAHDNTDEACQPELLPDASRFNLDVSSRLHAISICPKTECPRSNPGTR